jgi:hypothetical protein
MGHPVALDDHFGILEHQVSASERPEVRFPPAEDDRHDVDRHVVIRLARQLTLATEEPEARGLLALMLLNQRNGAACSFARTGRGSHAHQLDLYMVTGALCRHRNHYADMATYLIRETATARVSATLNECRSTRGAGRKEKTPPQPMTRPGQFSGLNSQRQRYFRVTMRLPAALAAPRQTSPTSPRWML